jgi:uncharacterized protein YraI
LVIGLARAHHKHVLRKPLHVRLLRIGVPTLALMAVGAPATAVWTDDEPLEPVPMSTAAPVEISPSPVPMRVAPISRSEPRVRLEEKPPEVVDHKFATTPLNIRTEPSEKARVLDVLGWAEKIAVTGETRGAWAEVVVDEESRWVHREFLAEDKPKPEPEGPSLGGSCSNGSSISAGRASLYEIHDVVCSNWPQVTNYGTWRGDGEHGQGRAVDIMVSGETGWAIANFLRANYAALGIEYIIYSQNIWSVERGGEGWRGMSDRGSTTANHYDHVHVTVY